MTRAATMAPTVEAHDLVKTYPGGITALAGLSITVAPATVFGLLGPNGAGKSTTIKILTTLARPDSGSASVAGHDVLRHPDRVRRVIGSVSQSSGADIVATGRENLLLQGHLYGMRGGELTTRVDELLERFDLAGSARRAIRTYSGGMRRRLDVALGLVHRPEVLFLDEPTTGLDPQAKAAMWDEIARLAAHDELAVVLTTHYLDEADRLADRLAIVDGGRVVAEGNPDELKGALRGDAVHIELRGDPDEPLVRSAISTVPGVREITIAERRVSARADDGAAAVPAVLAALDRGNVPVAAVTVARPSLDDVYLRHAGRRFAENAGNSANAGLVGAASSAGGVR